jgi:hypothetical protein
MVKYQIFAQAITCLQEASTEQELDGVNRWYGYGWGWYRGGKCKDKYDEKKCIKMKEAGKCEDKKVAKKCMKTCEKCEDDGGEGNIFFVNCTKRFFCKCY